MLLAPRLLETLYQRLIRDAELQAADVPGGIWKDVIPQEGMGDGGARLPAVVLTFIVGFPNAQQAQLTDLTFEARAEAEGTDIEDVREAMDRVDVLLRTAESREAGWKFSGGRKTQEIMRTSLEGGLLYAALGGQYTYTVSEAPIVSQL